MAVLFVTSFTRPMYEVTGRRLVRSFIDSGSEGTLLLCHEGFEGAEPVRRKGIRVFALERSTLLHEWLHRNRDLIPRKFGGEAGLCDCPEPRQPFGPHRPRCHGYWFNRNAARYFRKVVALDYAVRLSGYRQVVWLDSDCVIRKRISARAVRSWFDHHDVFFHKSKDRRVMESGVLGVSASAGGRMFVDTVVARYRSGLFRRNARWDDGYQLQLTLRSCPQIAAIDLASGASGPKPYGHVLPHSPVGGFIVHHKGTHARALDLW